MTKVRTPNPLVFFVVRKDILLMCARERIKINMTCLKTWVTIISGIKGVIGHMNARKEPCKHQDVKVTATTVKSMDIEPSSADLSPCGHQKNQQKKEFMDTSTIGTTILGKVVTTVKSINTSMRTT